MLLRHPEDLQGADLAALAQFKEKLPTAAGAKRKRRPGEEDEPGASVEVNAAGNEPVSGATDALVVAQVGGVPETAAGASTRAAAVAASAGEGFAKGLSTGQLLLGALGVGGIAGAVGGGGSSADRNDVPTIDAATNPASIVEAAGDSSAQNIAAVTGTITITDRDLGDTLTLTVTGDATAEYNGGAVPTGNSVDVSALIAGGAISFAAATSSGERQVITWTYDPAAADLDWLRAGDTLAITYVAQVNDGQGNAGARNLVITIMGTNDAPVASYVTSDDGTFTILASDPDDTALKLAGNPTTLFDSLPGTPTSMVIDDGTIPVTRETTTFTVKPQTTATSYRLVVEDVPGALTVVRNADGDEVVVSLGTLLDDVLAPAASNQASIYYGFAGDDAITGGGNNDSIYGGAGKDTINGGAGIDQIDGAGGNDTFVFFSASELEEDASVIGGDDIDTIRMDTGSSALSLSDADFANVSQMERLELNGTGSQTATLGTHASAAFVSSITIMTQAMATSLNLLGGASSVRIDATGTDNADTLIGGDGNDTLSGGNGDDWIDYGGGDNLVFGGDGDDYIDSTDVLGGADTIYGGDGNDLIYASAGDDHIIGGAGNDTLHGEAGVDTFVFEASGLANGTDRIVDYQTGSGGDRSDFSLFFDDEGSAFSASDFAVQGANGTGLVATGKVVQLWSGASNAVTDVDSAQDILDAFQNSVLVLAAGGKSVVISGEDTSAQAGYVWFADDTNGNGLELSEISLVATFDPIFLARFEQSSIIV